MSQSIVDLCNSALQKLGATSISSLSDNSREARQCNIAYDSNRRSELRKYRWNFAIKREILTPLSAAPVFDYTYAFQIPSDCLRVLNPPGSDWVVEGRTILTNSGNTLNLRYISDVTDLTLWDPVFYDATAISMAMDMCEAITNSNAKKQTLAQEYKDAIGYARTNNSFEQLPAEPPSDSWWEVRYSGVTGGQVNFTI